MLNSTKTGCTAALSLSLIVLAAAGDATAQYKVRGWILKSKGNMIDNTPDTYRIEIWVNGTKQPIDQPVTNGVYEFTSPGFTDPVELRYVKISDGTVIATVQGLVGTLSRDQLIDVVGDAGGDTDPPGTSNKNISGKLYYADQTTQDKKSKFYVNGVGPLSPTYSIGKDANAKRTLKFAYKAGATGADVWGKAENVVGKPSRTQTLDVAGTETAP